MADHQTIAALQRSARLIQVLTLNQRAELHQPSNAELEAAFDGPNVEWNRITMEEDDVALFPVQVALGLDLSERRDDGEGVAIFSCSVEVAALYGFSLDVTAADDEYAAFAQTAGVLAAFPYIRSTIQRLTADAGLPAFTIPLYPLPKIGPPVEDEEQEAGPAT